MGVFGGQILFWLAVGILCTKSKDIDLTKMHKKFQPSTPSGSGSKSTFLIFGVREPFLDFGADFRALPDLLSKNSFNSPRFGP